MNRKWLFVFLAGVLILSLAACTGVSGSPVEEQSQSVPDDTDMDSEEGHDDDSDASAETDADADQESDDAAEDETVDEAAAINAGEIFSKNCAGCHGEDRGGNKGPALLPDVLTKDTASYVNIITNGSGPMPTWGNRLSADEINALVEYIMSEPQ